MPRQIQVESMDEELRSSLWNALHKHLGEEYPVHWRSASLAVAKHLLRVPVDTVPGPEERCHKWLRDHFFGTTWHGVYDLVEFLVRNIDQICGGAPYYRPQYGELLKEMNRILELELSGYRFVRGVLAPVTSPAEVAAIEQAAQAGGYEQGAAIHIRTALALLGRKPHPDFRNSIKESISAVESAVNAAAGTDVGGVAKAIETLAARTEIHPSLRAAIKQLYGYSSDADGIRHAILEQTNIGYAEAAFMLVACSAFVNFLGEKRREASA